MWLRSIVAPSNDLKFDVFCADVLLLGRWSPKVIEDKPSEDGDTNGDAKGVYEFFVLSEGALESLGRHASAGAVLESG